MRGESRSVDRTALSLRSVAEQAWETVDTQGATLAVDADVEIRADGGLLATVFENLFRNAVEHGSTSSRPGADDAVQHGGADVTVTVGPLDDGFYVEDDGPGIPDRNRDDVFEVGFTTNPDGTGFGLGIVRHAVERHGWEIEVETGRTGGARFEVFTRPTFAEPGQSPPGERG